MHRPTLHSLILPLGVVVTLGAGSLVCTNSMRTQVESSATNALLPPDQEAQIGEQIEQELSQQVKFVSDPAVLGYVHSLTERVFAAAKSEAPKLSVKVHVIDDPRTVNAFATPGSQLYVYTGLLLTAKSDAELAGVLGHETGHIVARHPARHMVNEFGLATLTDMVLGKNAAGLQGLAASIASQGYLLANSRADETEADEYGARFASRASYDPRALGQFLTRISAGSPEPPKVLAFLSDHPMTPDRVAHLDTYIAQHDLSGQQKGGEQLAAVQRALSAHGVGGGPAVDGGGSLTPPKR